MGGVFTSVELSDHEPPSPWCMAALAAFMFFCGVMAALTATGVVK